jgi:transposase InsO family protein
MSYSNNPLLPKARVWAINLVVKEDLPLSVAARKAGVHRVTLWRWLTRWQELGYDTRYKYLPTLSSRPKRPAGCLSSAVVERIVYWRKQAGRCAAIVHAHCIQEGVKVSLASVKRVLKRLDLLRPVSKWKRYRVPVPRPPASAPGMLVQTDTIHCYDWLTKRRVYLYTLIDVYSRWAYVEYHESINQKTSYEFLKRGQAWAGFKFQTVQADNGPEFGRWLKDMLNSNGTTLRHSRVRKPNDNAHIERFNRTIQEECLHGLLPNEATIRYQLFEYLDYYNDHRLHLGLQCQTPASMLQRC